MGEFSRMTHLSVKTLRHYHQVGLLAPAKVNPLTGYRYYTAEQIPQAQVIRRLRDLEMPVPEVKEVLAAHDQSARNAVIASHLDRLETELEKIHGAVDSLRSILDVPASEAAIEHRTTGEMSALAVERSLIETICPPGGRERSESCAVSCWPKGLRCADRAGVSSPASSSNTVVGRPPSSFPPKGRPVRSGGSSPLSSPPPNLPSSLIGAHTRTWTSPTASSAPM